MSSRWSSYKPNDRPSGAPSPHDSHGRPTQDSQRRDRPGNRSPPLINGPRDVRDANFRGRRDFRQPPDGPSNYAGPPHSRPLLGRPRSQGQGSNFERPFRRSPPPPDLLPHHVSQPDSRFTARPPPGPYNNRPHRNWSPDANRRPEPFRRQSAGQPRGLTAADRDRLEREREAREYKAAQQRHRDGSATHSRHVSTPIKFDSRDRLKGSASDVAREQDPVKARTAAPSRLPTPERRSAESPSATTDTKAPEAIDIVLDLLLSKPDRSESPVEKLTAQVAQAEQASEPKFVYHAIADPPLDDTDQAPISLGLRNADPEAYLDPSRPSDDSDGAVEAPAPATPPEPTSNPTTAQSEEVYINPFDAMDDDEDELDRDDSSIVLPSEDLEVGTVPTGIQDSITALEKFSPDAIKTSDLNSEEQPPQAVEQQTSQIDSHGAQPVEPLAQTIERQTSKIDPQAAQPVESLAQTTEPVEDVQVATSAPRQEEQVSPADEAPALTFKSDVEVSNDGQAHPRLAATCTESDEARESLQKANVAADQDILMDDLPSAPVDSVAPTELYAPPARARASSTNSEASTVHLNDDSHRLGNESLNAPSEPASGHIGSDSNLQQPFAARSPIVEDEAQSETLLREPLQLLPVDTAIAVIDGVAKQEVDVDLIKLANVAERREELEERIKGLGEETLSLKEQVSQSDDRHQALADEYHLLQADLENLLFLLEAPLPRRKQYCRKFDETLSKQVLEANTAQSLLRKPVDRRRLYGEPQEHDFYHANVELFKINKAGVTAILARHRRENAENMDALRMEYEERQLSWKAMTAKYDHQRWFQLQQEEAATAILPGASASSRGTRGRPTGYEIREAFHGLVLPSNVLNEATIPALVSDPFERELYQFDDQNAKVDDPLELYKIGRVEATDYWTAEEQNVFIARFKATPKQFGAIAEGLPGRTAEDCVLHYYKSKSGIDYKTGKPRTKYAPRRGRPTRKGQARSSKRSIVATQEDADEDDDEEAEAVATKRRRRTAAAEGDELPKRARALRRPRRGLAADLVDSTDETRESSPAVSNVARNEPPVELAPSQSTRPTPPQPEQGRFAPPVPANSSQQNVSADRPFSWTDDDEAQFVDLLKRHGSDFGTIASWMPGKTLTQVQQHFDDHLMERNYRQYLPRPVAQPSFLSGPRNVSPAFGHSYATTTQGPPVYTHQSQSQMPPQQHQQQQPPLGPSHGLNSYRPRPMLSNAMANQYATPYGSYNHGPPGPPQNAPAFPYGRAPEGPGGYPQLGSHPFGQQQPLQHQHQQQQQSMYGHRGGPAGPPSLHPFHSNQHPGHGQQQPMPGLFSQPHHQRPPPFDTRHDRPSLPGGMPPLGPANVHKQDRPASRNSIDSILNGSPRDLPPMHRPNGSNYPPNQGPGRPGEGFPPLHGQGYHGNNSQRGGYFYQPQR